MHRATHEIAPTQGSPYMCPAPSLIICRITRRWLWPTRAYIRVNLLHPQGTHHFSQHFLHTLSQFNYWLERPSANVSVDTFCYTAKTHHHRAGNRYHHTGVFSTAVVTQPYCRCHSTILTEHLLWFSGMLYLFLI